MFNEPLLGQQKGEAVKGGLDVATWPPSFQPPGPRPLQTPTLHVCVWTTQPPRVGEQNANGTGWEYVDSEFWHGTMTMTDDQGFIMGEGRFLSAFEPKQIF